MSHEGSGRVVVSVYRISYSEQHPHYLLLEAALHCMPMLQSAWRHDRMVHCKNTASFHRMHRYRNTVKCSF
jgi:hypothetical protein